MVSYADFKARHPIVLAHTDLVASDVDWRRESGDRKVLDRRHAPTLRAGGVDIVCDHIGGDAPYGYLPATNLETTYVQRFMRALDHAIRDVEESDEFVLALSVADILKAKADGKIAFVICLEGGAPLNTEISYLRNYYRLGLRCIGLTHDVRNSLGDGVRERSAGGLTAFGVSVVEECARLGIVVDVSHLSDRGTEEAVDVSDKPIIASHSNARALCDHPRNLTDDLIRRIATKGGVVGIHALTPFISSDGPSTAADLARHVAHIAEVGGVDCVAIGPDIMENWDQEVFTLVSDRTQSVNGIPALQMRWTYSEDFKSNADLPRLFEALQSLGFSESELALIFGGNVLRLFRAVWGE